MLALGHINAGALRIFGSPQAAAQQLGLGRHERHENAHPQPFRWELKCRTSQTQGGKIIPAPLVSSHVLSPGQPSVTISNPASSPQWDTTLQPQHLGQ